VPSPFLLDRTWRFDVSAPELWRVLSRTEDFPRWWTWLHRFESSGLVEGTTARCLVRAPVPWSFRFDLDVVRVVPERLVETHVRGAMQGEARLEVTDVDPWSSEARIVWRLELRERLLRSAAVVARPVLEWGQNWIVDTGVNQFRRRAL
jgi:uncharacterized protein YndB with AHSA1/START domain